MALVLSFVFVACDKKDTGDKPNSNDLGVYYEVVGSSLDKNSYIELKSGNVWYDGEDQGTFKINGGNITLYDGDLELMSGTISNGVLTLSFMGETTVYKKSGSMGSGNVDQKAMIKSIQNGMVDGLTVSLEIDNTVEDVDLSGMITTSKDCSWQLYTSRTATSADAIVTKIIVPKNGNNTYYIVVTSADGKTSRTYTLNVWKNYYVTLSFYANGTLYTSEQVLTHTTYGSGPSCSVVGYTFNGWGCDGYYVTESKSFNANLTPLTYTAKFDSNGGSTVSDKTATFNKDLSLPTPYRTGYTFLGWYINGNLYNDSIKYTYTNDVTFTARWQINSYNVKIVSDDETCGTVNSFDGEKQYKSSVNLIATTKTDIVNSKCTLVFVGWFGNDVFLSSNLTYTATTPSNDIVYTAKWAKITISSNNSQAGDISGLKTINKVGDSLTITASTNLGYEFLGWYDGYKMVSDKATFTFAMPNTTKALVAKYKVADEMENFVFSSDQTSCIINGIKNKNITGIVVPNYVTRIGNSSFSGCSKLTSITIPDSVTSIGYEAFYGCKGLTSITIPDSVTSIGSQAFHGCTGLTSITIPDGVTSIGSRTFEGCTRLTSITIPNNVTSIGEYAFCNCTGLTIVNIGNNVTNIGHSAFYGCTGLTSVTIPDSVTSISAYAFNGCTGLTNVTIGNSVTSIGSNAFRGCYKLVEVYNKSTLSITAGSSSNGYVAYYAKNVYKNEGGSKLTTDENGYVIYTDGDEKILVAYLGTNTELILPSYITKIYQYAFYACSGLTSVTIHDNVTSIGDYAFSGTGLTTVNWNATACTSAGSYDYPIFKGCSNLATVNIGDNVKIIPSYAFRNCTGLTSITIPDSVTSIGWGAFYGCSGLTSVTIGNGVTSIDGGAFYDCSGLTSITIGNRVTSIGSDAFESCNNLQDIYITDIAAWCNISGLNYLMEHGASNKKLYINNELATSITIPDGVTSIGRDAFRGCAGLTSVTIGNGVTSIGGSAFYGCSGLTSVTIGNSVTSIGSWAFYGCKGLTSITIPNSVTSIGESAFVGCTGLTSVTIPNSVTSIGEGAFFECTGLTDIKFNGTITQWKAISKGTNWKYRVPATEVVCTDGNVSI